MRTRSRRGRSRYSIRPRPAAARCDCSASASTTSKIQTRRSRGACRATKNRACPWIKLAAMEDWLQQWLLMQVAAFALLLLLARTIWRARRRKVEELGARLKPEASSRGWQVETEY